jgi:hypothetical protein
VPAGVAAIASSSVRAILRWPLLELCRVMELSMARAGAWREASATITLRLRSGIDPLTAGGQ